MRNGASGQGPWVIISPVNTDGNRPLSEALRSLPSVDRLMSDERVLRLAESGSRDAVVDLVRSEVARSREAVKSGEPPPSLEDLAAAIGERAASEWRNRPVPVINATGVILHTNLGRAPLSEEAIRAVRRAAESYSDLELDLETGRRGSRQAHLSQLVCRLTGAGAAMAVNNNASAVMLGLAAVAAGKQVIVSRGEAVEIGGGFRIPDVLRQSGAELVEVGTTNRTYAHDYEAAITGSTGAILAVHASNFKVSGFTHSPDLSELVEVGRKHGVPVLHDLGSGCLLDTTKYGLAHEPMPQTSIAAGASLAFVSGDKLLGGPQAGIIAGTEEMVGLVSRHPLARAVRIDKLSMAALSATLLHYVRGEAERRVPIWRMVSASQGDIASRVEAWSSDVGGRVRAGQSTIGGGSLPGETLPTTVLALDGKAPGGADALAGRLRRASPPVIGRIEDDEVLLDPRTVLPEQDDDLVRGVRAAL